MGGTRIPCATCDCFINLKPDYARACKAAGVLPQCARCRKAGRAPLAEAVEMALSPLPTVKLSCPHCAGRGGSCCVCQKTRKVTLETALVAMQSVWARPGCACDTCLALELLAGQIARAILDEERPAPKRQRFIA